MSIKTSEIFKKFIKIRIPNLIFYIVLFSGIVFFADFVLRINSKSILISTLFAFDKELILNGQFWRIFSYIFIIPKINFALAFVYIYILNFIGNSLENHWGSLNLTIYYFIGFVLTTAIGFLTNTTTIVFLNLSLIFVFVNIYPTMTITLMSFINFKTYWLGVLTVIVFLAQLIVSIVTLNWSTLCAELTAIGLFVLFFGPGYFINLFKAFKQTVQRQRF